MGYEIDLKSISIEDYRGMLKAKDLLPSRRMLLCDIDAVFERLAKTGLKNAEEIYKSISTAKKLESVSNETGISVEYLTLLKREIGGLLAKIVPLAQFPELDPALAARLNEKSIRNSKDVYEATDGFKNSGRLCELSGISEEHSREVCALCDFVRVNGVGALFAHILYAAGYRSIEEVAGEDAERMRLSVNSVIAAKYSIENLGSKDAQYCIDYAALLIRSS